MSDLITMLSAASGAGGGAETDPYFNQTTLLLHGDGTNGAQNNTFLDSSSNTFTITRNGNTTQGTFSPFSVADGEWSNYFDGSGDYLTTPDSADFTLGSNNFCLEAWVYAITAPNYAQVCGQFGPGGVSNSDRGYWIRFDDTGKIQGIVTTDGTTATTTTAGTALSLNAWHHIAFVRNSNDLYLYIDGVQAGTTAFASSVHDSSLTFSIGGANNGAEVWNGYISNVRLVNGSPVYTGAFTPSATPLTSITNTKLLTCQGNRFYDANTQVTAKALTVNGNPSVQPFSFFAPTAAYSPSVNGGSGYFDGTGDYLSIADNAAFTVGSSEFTLEFWAYPTTVATRQIFFSQSSGTNTNATIGIEINASSKWSASANSGATNYAVASTNNAVANAWTHVCWERSGNTGTFYINGVSVGTLDLTGITINNSTANINISGYGDTATLLISNGYVSNLRLVIGDAVYTTGFTPPTSPPTAVTNTVLLTNFTNAGIFDNTGKNNLETVGNAQIDTTTVKYGTGSIEFDGTGDWLLLANNVNQQLGTGNFTIEFWVYLASGDTGSNRGLVAKGTSTTGFLVSLNTTEKVVFTYATSTITSSGAITTNAWNHIAVVREGTGSNQTKIYIGGTNDGTGTVSTDFNQTSVMYVGANRTGGDPMKGFIDDLRITKGVARYTANFTPPDKAFPDL